MEDGKANDGVSCPADLPNTTQFYSEKTDKNRAAYPELKAGQLSAGLGNLYYGQDTKFASSPSDVISCFTVKSSGSSILIQP